MFDSDPCWIGALCMQEFERASHGERRLIARARNTGSVPREIATELFDAIQAGRLSLICGEITDARTIPGNRAQLTISGDGEMPIAFLNSDLVILATGSIARAPVATGSIRRLVSSRCPVMNADIRSWTRTSAGIPGSTSPARSRSWNWARSPATSSEAVTPQADWRRRDSLKLFERARIRQDVGNEEYASRIVGVCDGLRGASHAMKLGVLRRVTSTPRP